MIDKAAYFFWDNTKMSWLRYMTLYSFRKLNPDWKIELHISNNSCKIKTWLDEITQDFCNYGGNDYFSKLYDLGIEFKEWNIKRGEKIPASMQSDIFRWDILRRGSGVYLDMDILFVKPMIVFDDVDIIYCWHKHNSLGMLGSSGNNKMFSDLHTKAFDALRLNNYQCVGPNHFLRTLKDPKNMIACYAQYIFYNLPMNTIYPFAWNDTAKIWKSVNLLPDDCIGIHWFAGDLLSQQHNNLVNDSTICNYNNTFTHYAKGFIK